MPQSDLPRGLRPVTTLQGPGHRATQSSWSPDGQLLAVVFANGSIHVWPQDGGDERAVLQAPAGGIKEGIEIACWSPDGRRLAAGRKGPVYVWDVASGERLLAIDVGKAKVSALAWDPAGEMLGLARFAGEEEGGRFSFRRYRSSDGVELADQRVERADWDGAYVAMSADRSLVALALESHEVELWDLCRLELVGRFPAQYDKPYGVALSPDRRIAALSYADNSVWLWDVRTGERLQGLQAQSAPAFSLDFSCDQTFLASMAEDGTVLFRRCADWRKRAIFTEPSKGAESEIAFHPRRLRLATYGDANTIVRLWDLDPDTLGLLEGDEMYVIRFFSANSAEKPLNLEKEMNEIQDHLAMATLRDNFDFKIRPAVRTDDLIRFLTADQPRVVHFSGHGTKGGAIIMLDRKDEPFEVSGEALSAVFRLVARHVKCVILNACYAEPQARAISEHIDYVVGMHTAISDDAAISYSKGFYQSLGNGVSFEEAHEFGVAQILLSGDADERATPVLLRREDFQKPDPPKPAKAAAAPQEPADAAKAVAP